MTNFPLAKFKRERKRRKLPLVIVSRPLTCGLTFQCQGYQPPSMNTLTDARRSRGART
jgi:hypothetical protein